MSAPSPVLVQTNGPGGTQTSEPVLSDPSARGVISDGTQLSWRPSPPTLPRRVSGVPILSVSVILKPVLSHMTAPGSVNSRVHQDLVQLIVIVDHPGQRGVPRPLVVQGGRNFLDYSVLKGEESQDM